MNRKRLFLILGGVILVGCVALLLNGWGLTLVNLPGLILVLGGTLLASVIGHGPQRVMGLVRRLPHLFREPPATGFADHQPFLRVALCYRRGDLRGAERASESLVDPFLRAGSRLALDPHNGEELTRVLEWRLRRQKDEDADEVRILRTMSTFAPAFGMLGTVFGLVSLLGELGSSGLDRIGLALGFALMTTLYGLLASNLVLRPLALKLEDRSRRRLAWMAFLGDALLMLHQRQHPVLIGEYLDSGLASPEWEPAAPVPVPERLALRSA